MPDDETALHYFDLYFANAHPYVPVLDKESFYHQWQSNRASISPLLLEAVFAIAGRLADEPAQGQQWLALATRTWNCFQKTRKYRSIDSCLGHADSFMDVPRLSTLQALLIILKAREQAPKRGYYYRSWMSVVQCVQMGKDLGLDEHYTDHQAGRPCGSSQSECRLKTRIWQTVFVCEVMIGSPQGKQAGNCTRPISEQALTPRQGGLSCRLSWKQLTSMSRGRYPTATSLSTMYLGTSLTWQGSFATSAGCCRFTAASKRTRTRTGESTPSLCRSAQTSTPG